MPTILYRKCDECTAGCEQCRMTGYSPILPTLEQVNAVLDNVPNVKMLEIDIGILRASNDAYAAENARLRAIINGDADASQ